MKKDFRKFLFLMMVIMLLPVFVMAKRVESDMSDTNSVIEKFELDKVEITNVGYTRFSNFRSTGRPAVVISGKVYNGYNKEVEVAMELNIYDKDKKVLDVFNNKVTVKPNNFSDYTEVIYLDVVNYKYSDIKYFSLISDIDSDLVMYGESEKDLYVFENYNIKVKVNTNNVYNIEESFDLKFRKHVDTIKFGIPFRLKYTREDGKKINKRAVMSNIEVNEDFELKTEEGIRNLYIGEEDREATEKSYNIKYDYDVGKDNIKGKDEFLFYLVNDRDNKIDGISFEIELPTVIKDEKIYFLDQHGTRIDSFIYEVNGNKIVGKYDGMINSGVSYAIKVVLADKYFKNTSNNISSVTIMTLFISVLFLAISILVWFAQRRRDALVKCNSIYFEKPINSLEMGYLYNGAVKDKDIATLLMTLANKGYINVDKTKKNYRIVKVKDYDSDDRVEKVFMNELFKKQDSITRKDLVNNVECMKNNIEFKLKDHQKKNKLFINPLLSYKVLFWIMIVVIFVLGTINIFFEYQESAIVVNCILGSIGFITLLYGMLYEQVKIEKALYIFVGLILIISPIVLTKYLAFTQDSIKLTAYIIGIISMIIIVSIAKVMSNRTLYGVKVYNQINAYKKYLNEFNDASKEMKKNKNCFYEVLPYTFVLGISDKWYHKFMNEDVPQIGWYKTNKFELEEFYSDIKDIYADIFISLKNSEK